MDIIPRDEKNETLPLLAEMLKDVVPQNITGMYAIKDFIKLAKMAIEIGRLPRVSSESLLVIKTYYIILTIVLRKKHIKMYNPDIPDDQTEGTRENTEP
jgi:hypothetical protein